MNIVKDRKMGTVYQLKKEQKKMNRDKTIKIVSQSKILPVKGSKRFYRMYTEYEQIK